MQEIHTKKSLKERKSPSRKPLATKPLVREQGQLPKTLAHDPAYYETVYPNYDRQNPPYKYQHYLDVIARYKKPSFSLLDVGCASGKFLMYARNKVKPFALYGLDVNAAAVDEARIKLPKAKLLVGSQDALEQMPEVDVITAFDVLEHVDALDDLLTVMDEKLSPDGLLVAVVPVYDGPLGPIVHALDKDPTHVHKESRGFWVEKLATRFDLLHWHGIFRILTPVGVYLHFPSRIGRTIAPAAMLVARKKWYKQ